MKTRGLAAVAALALAGLTVLPVGPAAATALPKPRNEEWWFSAWGIEKMAWPESTGRGVTVAVLDTGVNASLPELRGAVVPGTDVTGQHPGDGRQDTDTDKGGHGTAMAALIAGQGNGSGMLGVAPDAKVMPIVTDAFSVEFTKAIRYAADHGAQVISISQGTPTSATALCDRDLQQAIAYAIQKNAVIVASAGNEGRAANKPEFPGSCAGVLTVGAIDNHLKAWPDTASQPYVAVASPGVFVGSIDKRGTFNPRLSGTSQATALTSAAVALVRAKFPKLSPREVVQRIISTTVDAGPAGHDDQTGAGAVLPPDALTKDVDKNAANPPFADLDKWLATQGKAPLGAPAQQTSSPKSSSSSPGLGILLGAALVVVLVVGVVVFLVVRRRRPPAGAVPQWQQPRPGPPPSFGPQNNGPRPPQQGGYPAPDQSQRPSFLPPHDQGPTS